MYDEFVKRNPTFEARISALTSGILTPDTKALALWTMEKDRYYTASELYTHAERFAGAGLPISSRSLWQYCNGDFSTEGSLYSIGAVVKDSTVDTGRDSVLAYRKTDAGADFGDPIAALACMAVNKLDGSSQRPRFASMRRILGAANKAKGDEHRRGYAVYKIIKLLAENPDRDFRKKDVVELTGLNEQTLLNALADLGRTGIIYYFSPLRDIGGKKNSGWATSVVEKEILDADFDDIYESTKARRKHFKRRSELSRVFEYCKTRVGREVEYHLVRKETGVINASTYIHILKELGYLSIGFNSKEKVSSARCTEHTISLWQDVFADVERVALDVVPHCGLGRALNVYKDDNLRLSHVRRWMKIYETERTQRGPKHGEMLRQKVLEKLTNEDAKLSAVLESMRNEGFEGSCKNVYNNLQKLKKSGRVVSSRRGYYRLA